MTDKDRALVKQLLLAKRSYVVGGHTKHEWVNPDGPAAITRIEALEAENERLRGVLRYYMDKDDYGERARAALGEKQ